MNINGTDFMRLFYQKKTRLITIGILLILLGTLIVAVSTREERRAPKKPKPVTYWFELRRKSNTEILYRGVPGERATSVPVRTFGVKTGIPGKRPTPLPKPIGREYWVLTKKEPTDNPETAPYFLTLDIPVSDEIPYGPQPYLECDGQCNWELPGAFGLHGVNGDLSRLSADNPGSSGCIRHKDEDIAYLYTLLDPEKEEIRYYIEDV
jgi:hypothetical protein